MPRPFFVQVAITEGKQLAQIICNVLENLVMRRTRIRDSSGQTIYTTPEPGRAFRSTTI